MAEAGHRRASPGSCCPLLGLGGFQLQVGIDALVIALLAVGLNIVVGWAGLLDLGYVAFFGFGAYGFALLSSARSARPASTCPPILSVPLVMVGAAVLGLLVGWPSRRLIGDYLAIVTLFFGEAFVEFTNNVAPGTLGGPNGIVGIDPIQLVRHTAHEQSVLLLPAAWSCWSWSWRCCGCSTPRAPAGPGARSARTRWPRRR